jgi:hypothetical protein
MSKICCKRLAIQDTTLRKKQKYVEVKFADHKNKICYFQKYRNYKMSAKYMYGITPLTQLEISLGSCILPSMDQFPFNITDGIRK